MRSLLAIGAACLLTSCAVTVDESSLLPAIDPPEAGVTLAAPPGYARTERMIDVGGLGEVHGVRLDRPDSEATVIFAGGSGYFSANASRRLTRLAELTGADILTFDYPGRAGTTVPRTAEALSALGPALVTGLREAGWIGAGPLYAYGFSFGGASAAGVARAGGFDGLILESTSSDINAMGRNMIPGIARPFVRLRIDDDLNQFDFLGFAASARAPVLLIGAEDDAQADRATVEAFAARLRDRGLVVTLVFGEGGHGDAIYSEPGGRAVRTFTSAARN